MLRRLCSSVFTDRPGRYHINHRVDPLWVKMLDSQDGALQRYHYPLSRLPLGSLLPAQRVGAQRLCALAHPGLAQTL